MTRIQAVYSYILYIYVYIQSVYHDILSCGSAIYTDLSSQDPELCCHQITAAKAAQKFPGLLVLCYVAPPADGGMVKVAHFNIFSLFHGSTRSDSN